MAVKQSHGIQKFSFGIKIKKRQILLISYKNILSKKRIVQEDLEKIENVYNALLQERSEEKVGYYDLPINSLPLLEKIDMLLERKIFKRAESIVVVGVGGSSLGTKAIEQALKPLCSKCKPVIFLENPDPLEIHNLFQLIDKDSTIFIVISKSGQTIETLSLFKLLIDHFKLDFTGGDKERTIFISDEGSPLHRLARKHHINFYSIPQNVGGRFSVLSAVGIVPLTLAGYDTRSLLLSAKEMVERFFSRQEDHILSKALYLAENWQQYPMHVLFAYGSYLEGLTKWYIQLWGESLGKINAEGKHIRFNAPWTYWSN